LALLVALAFLWPALAALDDFGPTWDHVQGEYPHGERLLAYLETGDPAFLDLFRIEPSPVVREPHLDLAQRRFPSHFVYTIGALSSALSCRILWTELELVPPMTAHHLPATLFAALLVFVVTYFAARRIGTLGALVAGLSLACAPTFFGHAAHNIQDSPECCLYTLAVLAGLRALERGRARAWILAGILAGLALAQKPNALFLPVQLALFLGLCAWRLRPRSGHASPLPHSAGPRSASWLPTTELRRPSGANRSPRRSAGSTGCSRPGITRFDQTWRQARTPSRCMRQARCS
jgi:hypothetical protein